METATTTMRIEKRRYLHLKIAFIEDGLFSKIKKLHDDVSRFNGYQKLSKQNGVARSSLTIVFSFR